MSPQGISSMLSIRMIERHRGTSPPQYRVAQSTEEEAYEDIPDYVPPHHRLSHHYPLVQFMRQLHMLTSLSASPDLSISVFNDLTTLMLLYSRFFSISTSHCQSYLANHLLYRALKLIITEELKLHRERFSTTAMSYSTTTIATTRYNILLAQDLWPNEPLRPPEYPPPLSTDYSPKL
ncbi:hypothetical protein PVK06_001870 [Gossypium arboreum]|uniref:Uncharacterized protein n=1 Tax=Gossypium arboreum TaxID=29729 RepID=A0ABR0R254_GOSAR|nr:hypothetical protein PVK06_001870 [Gossypium arboreum]